jgi:cytochrome c oxidase cbb3-type subunit III
VDAVALLCIMTHSTRHARSGQARWSLAVAIVVAIVVPRMSAAQSNADIQAGKNLFSGMCVTCHGFDGTGGAGPPLDRPKLLLAPDEKALRNIISEGIPDRGMPRVRRVTDNEMRQLVAYVRSLGKTTRTPITGNAQKGREHYDRLGCASCHIINGQGGSLGPSLNEIGRLRGADYLRQALVEPGAMLPRGTLPVPARGYSEYLPVRVVMKDGSEIRGVRLNEDVFTIQLRDLSGAIRSIRKTNAEVIRKDAGTSVMPSFGSRLNSTELNDLVAYLAGLGGVQ